MIVIVWGLLLFLLTSVLICLSYLYLTGRFRSAQQYHLTGISASAPQFMATVSSMSDSLLTSGQATQYWADIDVLQKARLALMAKAQQLIQFETFMMEPGKRANDFAEVLSQKAAEGVTVQILVDSYGAYALPDRYWRQLKNAGVEVRFFNPFSGRSPLDYLRRNHRKLLVVDQQVAMVGGAGIADCWDGQDQHQGKVPWYDFEVEWQGAVVGLLAGFFWQHWLSAGGYVDLRDHHPQASQATDPLPILITPGEDPTTHDSPIRSLFQLCISSVQTRLWIASPYLLPDNTTCKLLLSAKQRGVDIRILTMGPRSDKPYVYHVSRERYGTLLQGDIKIYEYQPSMMHAKMVLMDNHCVSLGSSNLDPRSFFHNDELNLCMRSQNLIQHVAEFFEQGFSDSQLIHYKTWQKRPFEEKLKGQLGNLFYWQL